MVSAIAPNADIILVEANSADVGDLGAAENEAVAMGASYVSNSYGASASALDPQYDTDYYDHPGVAIVASAGDAGYGVEFPAASTHVTAVGGTALTQAPGTTRGWTETAWSGTGSGCSALDAKPSFQADTGCSGRTVADVSAVADPYTGVAVYDTYSDGNVSYGQGWGQYGGTSVASPIITATYALGGPIAKGDYPNADPYYHATDLNDVTSGSNGTCSPSYLCTAGPGYDGPTGLGTPNGTAAFTDTSFGTLTGIVTTTSGKPIAGAQIHITGTVSTSTITNSEGSYQVRLPAGSYTVSVSEVGYVAGTAAATVTVGSTTTGSVTLKTAPTVTLSGTVADGSGHGWPVRSSIVLDYGTGTFTATTSLLTGKYSIQVPGDYSYKVQVTPGISGYAAFDTTLTAGSKNITRNFRLTADLLASEGSAPGYAQNVSATTQTFTSGTLPSGCVNVATTGAAWAFESTSPLAPPSGVATASAAAGAATDASLYTPVVSVLAGQTPLVSFASEVAFGLAQADVSTDGGKTWQTEWSEKDSAATGQVQFTLPSSNATQSVQLRFRYQGFNSATETGLYWNVTNVRLGAAYLTLKPGGLVEGNVTDANTGKDLDGVSLTVSRQSGSSISAPLAGADGGFYYLFSAAGRHTVIGTLLNYGDGKQAVTVAANKVARTKVAMPAGRFRTSGSINATVSPDGTATRTLTLANTGDHAASVVIDQFPGLASGDAAAVSQPLSPATRQPASATAVAPAGYETLVQRLLAAKKKGKQAIPTVTGTTTSSAPAWSTLDHMPAGMFEGFAGSYDGTVYAGLDGTGKMYSYDPATKAWATEASAPVDVGQGGYATIGDKLYVTGGIGDELNVVTETQVYDMATNTWSTAAANPYTIDGTDVVLDGKLYQVAGASPTTFRNSDTVSVYDPSTNTWSEVAPYPVAVQVPSCGAIGGTLYCAGGANSTGTNLSVAYKYTPGDSSWQQIASLPIGLGGSAFGVADDELLVTGGVINGTEGQITLTTAGYAYNPAKNWWVPLPAAAAAKEGAAGVVAPSGFYTFGGMTASFTLLNDADALTGYDQAGRISLPWLSLSKTELTIQPGHKVTITIRLNAAEAGLSDSGTVTAALGFESDTPYAVSPVNISLKVG
jgi:N-acetylneuraminic acid mutarotase